MDRRKFLNRSVCAALGGASIYSQFGNMQLARAAALQGKSTGDYKALVCLMMLGGNDSFNTIVPISGPARTQYDAARSNAMKLAPSQIIPITPFADGLPSDDSQYGLQKATSVADPVDAVGMSGLASLFDQGKVAIVANVGTLVQPTTKAQFHQDGFPLPPAIGAHNDQQDYWQTSRPNNSVGWGGRIADLILPMNQNQSLPPSFSIRAGGVFLRGAVTSPYGMNGDPQGAQPINFVRPIDGGRRAAFLKLMEVSGYSHKFHRAYADNVNRTMENYDQIATALAATPPLQTQFPNTLLGSAMKMVARTISVQAQLGQRRQVFFVEQLGFDTHDTQMPAHRGLIAQIAQVLTAFYNATVDLGVADKVTTFTASDFGRATPSNGDGTDHGWGGHHFVVGGAVRGGRFFGQMPNLSVGSADDAERGTIIPKIAVDQYGATMARWFGVPESNLVDVYPNLGNFGSSDLGFMTL